MKRKIRHLHWTAIFVLLLALIGASSTRCEAASSRNWSYFSRANTEREGYSGVVRAAQYLLRDWGYHVVTDGVFGAQTEGALRRFQREHSLTVNGALNSATWERLVSEERRGGTGQSVRAVQLLLNLAGYGVKQDGIFGRETEKAVRKFQQTHDMFVDGVVGRNT